MSLTPQFNASPVPQTDLSQLLLGLSQSTNSDDTITQAVITDFAEADTPDTVNSGDGVVMTTHSGVYVWGDPIASLWGFAQYG